MSELPPPEYNDMWRRKKLVTLGVAGAIVCVIVFGAYAAPWSTIHLTIRNFNYEGEVLRASVFLDGRIVVDELVPGSIDSFSNFTTSIKVVQGFHSMRVEDSYVPAVQVEVVSAGWIDGLDRSLDSFWVGPFDSVAIIVDIDGV